MKVEMKEDTEDIKDYIGEDHYPQQYDLQAYEHVITTIQEAQEGHFWFQHRDRIIRSLFHRFISPRDVGIEVGAGNGHIASMLVRHGYQVYIGEPHPVGIKLASQHPLKPLYRFDLLDQPFDEEFDFAAVFDVLEHIRDDTKAMDNLYQMIKPGGRLILSVPAHQWLWCRNDEIVQHCRRYHRAELTEKLKASGFTVEYYSHRFAAILPFLLMRAMSQAYTENIGLPGPANSFFSWLCQIEEGLIKAFDLRPGLGGTIFAVAQKPKSTKDN